METEKKSNKRVAELSPGLRGLPVTGNQDEKKLVISAVWHES